MIIFNGLLIRAEGLLIESFVRPPVDWKFQFRFPVRIVAISINGQVGNQISDSISVFVEEKAASNENGKDDQISAFDEEKFKRSPKKSSKQNSNKEKNMEKILQQRAVFVGAIRDLRNHVIKETEK